VVQIGGGRLGMSPDPAHRFIKLGWEALIIDAAPGFEAEFPELSWCGFPRPPFSIVHNRGKNII
jgi:hypothetical protein